MSKDLSPDRSINKSNQFIWIGIVIAACVSVILVGLFLPSQARDSASDLNVAEAPQKGTAAIVPNPGGSPRVSSLRSAATSGKSAEEIVANKLRQFVRGRRDLAHELAARLKIAVPTEVEKFLDVLDSGNWDEIKAEWDQFSKTQSAENSPFRSEMRESFVVAETIHLWPAQSLIDYGNAILSSLRPGMVYMGGTDAGLGIPLLFNETSGSEPHIILHPPAFADSSYLEYMHLMYGDRLATIDHQELNSAYSHYIADAQNRFQHDQETANEPRQLRPGENVQSLPGGRVQITGPVAVMAIDEGLLQTLMQKNPDVSFAIEQSFLFKATYSNAAPLGPLIELRVNEEDGLTQERAASSISYWRAASQKMLADSLSSDSTGVRSAYSKLVSNQADLFQDRSFGAEAEQMFQLALSINPSNADAVSGYIHILVNQNRASEAIGVARAALKASPGNQTFQFYLTALQPKPQ